MPIDGASTNTNYCTMDGKVITEIPELKHGELTWFPNKKEVCIKIEMTDDIDLVTIDGIRISRKE